MERRKLFLICLLFILTSGIFASGFAKAATNEGSDDDWDSSENVTVGTLDKARNRLYPGGRDEQDLKVQTVLPAPSRYPDGQFAETLNADRPAD